MNPLHPTTTPQPTAMLLRPLAPESSRARAATAAAAAADELAALADLRLWPDAANSPPGTAAAAPSATAGCWPADAGHADWPMAQPDNLQTLLDEFARRIGLTDLALDETGRCALRFNGTLTVEMAAHGAELQVHADLGALPALPAPDLSQLCTDLLQANLFGNGTHGATLALSGDRSPRVILAQRVLWRHCTACEFEMLIEQFVEVAEQWSSALQATPQPP